jgi:hypothetical protein
VCPDYGKQTFQSSNKHKPPAAFAPGVSGQWRRVKKQVPSNHDIDGGWGTKVAIESVQFPASYIDAGSWGNAPLRRKEVMARGRHGPNSAQQRSNQYGTLVFLTQIPYDAIRTSGWPEVARGERRAQDAWLVQNDARSTRIWIMYRSCDIVKNKVVLYDIFSTPDGASALSANLLSAVGGGAGTWPLGCEGSDCQPGSVSATTKNSVAAAKWKIHDIKGGMVAIESLEFPKNYLEAREDRNIVIAGPYESVGAATQNNFRKWKIIKL